MFYTENKSHIPNSPLREDIVREVNRYIGYAYEMISIQAITLP